MSAGHGHGPAHHDEGSKRIGLLISILALVLAFSETLGKGAQTEALSLNIEASNLWTFFQAKTVRLTMMKTAAESGALELANHRPRRLSTSRSPAGARTPRLRPEPETNEAQGTRRARQGHREKRDQRSPHTTTTNRLRRGAIAIVLHRLPHAPPKLWVAGAPASSAWRLLIAFFHCRTSVLRENAQGRSPARPCLNFRWISQCSLLR